jgi:hypothetical protein
MPAWSTLSGFYEGSDYTCYEEEAWKCHFELQFDDTGKVNGSGYLTPGDDFAQAEPSEENISVPVVILGQITNKGSISGLMVAPDRYDGVSWVLSLQIHLEKKELTGEVMYFENTPCESELGTMELEYKHGL